MWHRPFRPALALTLFTFSCGGGGGDAPPTPGPASTPLPTIALPDPIDYGVLGSGRLCFQRLVSGSSSPSGVFVIDGRAQRTWGYPETSGGGMLFSEPAISPDGSRIAYSSITDAASAWDIYLIEAERCLPARQSSAPGNELVPAWTPSGALLWLDSSEPCDRQDTLTRETASLTGARVVTVRGGLAQRTTPTSCSLLVPGVPSKELLNAPAFSPDGTRLAWIRLRYGDGAWTDLDVVVGDSAGRNAEVIATLPLPGRTTMGWAGGNNLSLAWSPDGSRIAFNRPESVSTGHLFVVTRDGSRLAQLTSAAGVGDRSVSWSLVP
jgi:Tol biopolymer transport system component